MLKDLFKIRNLETSGLINFFSPFSFRKNVIFKSNYKFYFKDISKECLDIVSKKEEVFKLYTRVCKKNDLLNFMGFGIVCDVYVINYGFLGREYNKTLSFALCDDKKCQREMIFEVLNGSGIFLLENLKDRSEVKAIFVKKGNFIVIPKGYGYVIINTNEKEKFVCLSLRDKDIKIKKSIFENQSGAFIFYTKMGFIKNQNTKPFYNLEEIKGDYTKNYIFNKELGLYREFMNFSQKFGFLKE